MTFLVGPILATASSLGAIGYLAAAQPDAIGNVVTGAGATAAVGAIIWIAKKVIAGEVVPLPVKQLIEATREENSTLKALVSEMVEARKIDRELQRESTQALYGVREYIEVVKSFPRKEPQP